MAEFPQKMLRKSRGGGGKNLIEVTGSADIPFEIKRIFYIYGLGDKNIVRGMHANRKSQFVLCNILGSSKVRVIDENGKTEVYVLDRPDVGLYLPQMVWKEMYDFSENSVLMVLSSERYDAAEYIRDFEEFTHELGMLEE